MFLSFCLFLLGITGTLAYSGEYIPKAIYTIDEHGNKYDLIPLLRVRRAQSSASSHASASSSSSSSGGGGGGGPPIYFGGDDGPLDFGAYAGFADPNFAQRFAQPGNLGYKGPILFSRMGETEGSGIQVSGSAQGERGAFSSSSSSIDSNGKIKYSVQSGKY